MWLWNKKQAREVTKTRPYSAFWPTQNTSNFILEIRGTHQWMPANGAGLWRLAPEVRKGVGSGNSSGGSQGKLDTSSATRAGGKEPNV